MTSKSGLVEFPKIIIRFADGECTWHSVGWGNNPTLRAAAKQAINKAETREEVVEFLTDAGFEVQEF